MKNILLFIVFNLTLSLSAQNKIEFEEFDLKNGLHVILHQDRTTPIVAVTMMYHVGSKNEYVDQTGFAHLTFEGSKNIKRGEFDNYVNSAGGQLNANTSPDRTFYYELLPSNQLELGLWLESERMLHAEIAQIGVDTQREVVKEEKRQRYSRPYATFPENIFKRLYTKHPYNWTPIGSMEHLNSARLENFISFYARFYSPNNATLSLAGDFDIPETKELIKAYFNENP